MPPLKSQKNEKALANEQELSDEQAEQVTGGLFIQGIDNDSSKRGSHSE